MSVPSVSTTRRSTAADTRAERWTTDPADGDLDRAAPWSSRALLAST